LGCVRIIAEGSLILTFVRIHEEEPFEIALKKFRYQCNRAGIFAEVRKRSYMKSLAPGNIEISCLQKDAE
jgi:hypothetical protein